MVAQFWSGFLLALLYLAEPAFVILARMELALEVWWHFYVHRVHLIGVDVIFTLSYLHIFKKLYLKNYTEGDLDGWFTGAYAFVVFHGVVFLGIALNSTHLADVTIMIIANMAWSLVGRLHRAYTPIFLNRHASIDLTLRFAALHYVLAYYYLHLVQTHIVHVHEA